MPAQKTKSAAKVEKKPVEKKSGAKRVTFEKGKNLTSTEPANKALPTKPKTSAIKTRSSDKTADGQVDTVKNVKAKSTDETVKPMTKKKTNPPSTIEPKAGAKKTKTKASVEPTDSEKPVEPKKRKAETKTGTPQKKAKPAKKVKVAPVQESDEEDVPDEQDSDKTGADEMTQEQEDALKKELLGDAGSSSEGEDSSDEEVDDTFGSNRNVVALDQVKQKVLESKAAKKNRSKVESSEIGVLYLGRIPRGFDEKRMKAYFEQFGDVTRLRLSRNKKTGKSKHYGFIEFKSKGVAEIVADTMHNYLLDGRLFQCKLIPKERVHENLFKGSGREFKPIPTGKIEHARHNRTRTDDEEKKRAKRLIRNENKSRERLKEAGIKYDFSGYKACLDV